MTAFSESQLAAYHRNGFAVVPGLFSASELKPLIEAVQADETLGGHQFAMFDTHGQAHPAIAWVKRSQTLLGTLPFSARIVERAESVLQERCYLWLSKLTIKPPRSEALIEWHQDFAAWHDEGCPRPKLITCGVALNKLNSENGVLAFYAGSHRLGCLEHEYLGGAQSRVSDKAMAMLEGSAHYHACGLEVGDAVFFHANTVHGSAGNRSGKSRTLLLCSYNALSNAPADSNETARPAKPIIKVLDNELAGVVHAPVFSGLDFIQPDGRMMQGFGKKAVHPG